MNIVTIDGKRRITVGTPSFLFSFYSTIVCNVPDYAQYKSCMTFLHEGKISADACGCAASDLEKIHLELEKIPPKHVVWDMNDRSKLPPWKDNISSHITSLGNYFVTADGKDLIDELISVLEYAAQHHVGLEIED